MASDASPQCDDEKVRRRREQEERRKDDKVLDIEELTSAGPTSKSTGLPVSHLAWYKIRPAPGPPIQPGAGPQWVGADPRGR